MLTAVVPPGGRTALLLVVLQCVLCHAKVVMDTSMRPPATQNDLLRESALHGKLEDVQAALDAGAELAHVDKRGHSALQNAAVKGHTAVVAYLIEKYRAAFLGKGMDQHLVLALDRQDERGRTAVTV
jgi:ankyrin repeat protein